MVFYFKNINKCNYGKTLETICVCFLRIQIKISDTHQLCCPAALHCACTVAEYTRCPWSKYFTFKSSFFNALTQTPTNGSATLHMHFPNAKVPINPPKTNHQTNANRIANAHFVPACASRAPIVPCFRDQKFSVRAHFPAHKLKPRSRKGEPLSGGRSQHRRVKIFAWCESLVLIAIR